MSDTLDLTTTSVDLEVMVTPYEESNDPNRKSHYVNGERNPHIYQPGMKAADIVNIARLTGKTVTALCGYTWVPKHNPQKFDVCEKCADIAYELLK